MPALQQLQERQPSRPSSEVRPGDAPLVHGPEHALDRGALEALARIRRRSQLAQSPVFHQHQAEVSRVLNGFSWDLRDLRAPLTSESSATAIAWNAERGAAFAPLLGCLQEHPKLAATDLILLTEVDIGMGRSYNRDVPRELAAALGMGYVFANNHILLSPGDASEQDHGRPNTLALHGCALLTRYPIRRFCGVSLPEYRDKFHVVEKRLGSKRALLAEVMLPCGPTTVVVAHLDPFCPPTHRGRQIQILADALAQFGGQRVLLGGDLNTNTYNLGSMLGLLGNFSHKLTRFGFAGAVAQYMTPGEHYDRPVFSALSRNNFVLDGFNDLERGTLYYRGNNPKYAKLTNGNLPRGGVLWHGIRKWIDNRLEPYGGAVPMRLDWFAGRGLEPLRAEVVDRPLHAGQEPSDHNPIVVEVAAKPTQFGR